MIPFSFKTTKIPSGLLIELVGSMDESMDLTEIKLASENSIIFDFGKVARINSIGIRGWLIWTKSHLAGRQLTFRNCPPWIIDQVNLVPGFVSNLSHIESFLIPFACLDCNLSNMLLMESGKHFHFNMKKSADAVSLRVPEAPFCKGCGKRMSPDILEATYFRFLKNT